jgi:hypothetical protein
MEMDSRNADQVSDVVSNSSPRRFRTVIGSEVFYLDTSGAELEVFTKTGQRLDATSAEVILALGGEEPRWLRVVEALSAVHSIGPRDQQALLDAAAAIGQKKSSMVVTARDSCHYAELVALAEMGVHQVVTNPLIDPLIWRLLMDDRDVGVSKRALAAANVLPPSLADYPDPLARIRVARNPLCPSPCLERLARDEDASVQAAAAANANTPATALMELGVHSDVRVRQAIAANTSAPRVVIDVLLKDRTSNVRSAAVTNPALSARSAAERIWIDPTPAVHLALASRVDLSPRSLSWVERYARRDKPQTYALVRDRIRQHPACPTKLEARLDKIERRLASRPKPRTSRNPKIRTDVVLLFPLVLAAIIGGGAMAVVGIVALFKAFWVKDLVLLSVGLVLVALGIRGVRWWLYTRRPDWSGAYWAPPRRREVTQLAFVVVPVALLIAGNQSQSNDQQNAPWGAYAVICVILAIAALRWLRPGFKRVFGRSAT